MEKKKIKRRYLINKKYQLGNALAVTLAQIPSILLTAFFLSFFFLIMADSRMVASCNTGLFFTLGLVCLAISAGVVWMTIRQTHAVAGPVEKTTKALRDMARGNLPEDRVTFRKNDRFKELCTAVNEVADSMKQDKTALAELKTELSILKADLVRINKPPETWLDKIDDILERIPE